MQKLVWNSEEKTQFLPFHIYVYPTFRTYKCHNRCSPNIKNESIDQTPSPERAAAPTG